MKRAREASLISFFERPVVSLRATHRTIYYDTIMDTLPFQTIPSQAKGRPIHCLLRLRSFPCQWFNHAMPKGTQPAVADWIYVADYLRSAISTENTSTGQSTYLKMDMPSTFSEIISGLNQFNPTNHPCDARRLAALLKHIQWAVVTSFVQFNSQKTHIIIVLCSLHYILQINNTILFQQLTSTWNKEWTRSKHSSEGRQRNNNATTSSFN